MIDVGLASVIGADRLTDGESSTARLRAGQPIRVDVYGPVNYLAYVPFEQAFPWSGEWDEVPAARAAALGFDLLTALALFALGGAAARGARRAGPWASRSPSPGSPTRSRSTRSAPASTTRWSRCWSPRRLLVLSSAPAAGRCAALAGLTKFGPLALVPLLAAGTGDRRPRSLLAFAPAFVAVAARGDRAGHRRQRASRAV